MKIECTPQELKELLKRETPVAGTTDVTIKANEIIKCINDKSKEFKNANLQI